MITHNVQQNVIHVGSANNSNNHIPNPKETITQKANKSVGDSSKNEVNYNNNNYSEMLVDAKAGKTITKDGIKFQGLKAMKIAPNMEGSMFLATPGFDANGFSSGVNQSLYNYELNLNNDQAAIAEATRLHGGNPVDTCVFFQSSALRAIGQNVPYSIGYTTVLENWLSDNGWTKHTDFAYIQRGDLCFASYYHTFLFMGWKDKAKGVAWVMGNESFTEPYYRRRNLNGQSPEIYGNDSYYQTTCYWTYGRGYTGPQTAPDPVGNSSGVDAVGTTRVTSPIGLNICSNVGGGNVLDTIPNNVVVPVMSEQNGWFNVFYNGVSGWIDGQYTSGLAESMGGGGQTESSSSVGGPYTTQPVGTTTTPQSYIGTGVINANGGLWLNNNPSLTNPGNIEIIPNGANVNIISKEGAWYKVDYNGQIGWSYAQYITANISKTISQVTHTQTNSSGNIAVTTLDGTTTITASDLYLNNMPEPTWSGATAIATIPGGTTVKVIGKTANGWFKVTYQGNVGYIASSYTTGYNRDIPKLNGWVSSGGNHYLYNNGVKLTGWQEVNNKWYYLDSSGILQTGWKSINNVWYYLGDTGARQTGLQSINGKIYAFSNAGVMLQGWQTINGNKYYFTNSGSACVTSMVIGNTRYIFNNNGVLTGQTQVGNSGTATITASELYLNNAPEPTWDGGVVVTTLNRGDVVTILETCSNGWAKVEYQGHIGYIDLQYATVNRIKVNSSNTLYTVNSDVGLWLMQSPSIYGNQLQVMPHNANVRVIGVDGDWLHVIYNGQTGWAYNQYLTEVGQQQKQSMISVTSSVGLWLLTAPNMQGGQIEVMPYNVKLTVLGTSGDWTKVSYEGQVGWCYTAYTQPIS